MEKHDPVLSSLEILAEQDDDIAPRLYRAFSERCPEQAALMSHMDDYMVGRMMGDVLTLLMTPPDDVDADYLGFEVSSHRAYGVTADMFPPLLDVVRDEVRKGLGTRWSDAEDRAWQQRIAGLSEAIRRAAAAA